jgi:hypothetical protein
MVISTWCEWHSSCYMMNCSVCSGFPRLSVVTRENCQDCRTNESECLIRPPNIAINAISLFCHCSFFHFTVHSNLAAGSTPPTQTAYFPRISERRRDQVSGGLQTGSSPPGFYTAAEPLRGGRGGRLCVLSAPS